MAGLDVIGVITAIGNSVYNPDMDIHVRIWRIRRSDNGELMSVTIPTQVFMSVDLSTAKIQNAIGSELKRARLSAPLYRTDSDSLHLLLDAHTYRIRDICFRPQIADMVRIEAHDVTWQSGWHIELLNFNI